MVKTKSESKKSNSSLKIENNFLCLSGEIGRHKRLKISRLNRRAGSIPASGTKLKLIENLISLCLYGGKAQ